jgi:hypothetical protein
VDDPIDQTFFSDYPKAFTPDHTVSEMAALVFDLVVAIFDDEFGDVMFCGNNDGVAFFEWRGGVVEAASDSQDTFRINNRSKVYQWRRFRRLLSALYALDLVLE